MMAVWQWRENSAISVARDEFIGLINSDNLASLEDRLAGRTDELGAGWSMGVGKIAAMDDWTSANVSRCDLIIPKQRE